MYILMQIAEKKLQQIFYEALTFFFGMHDRNPSQYKYPKHPARTLAGEPQFEEFLSMERAPSRQNSRIERAPSRATSRTSNTADLASNVRVVVRFRPQTASERASGEAAVSVQSASQCQIEHEGQTFDFAFDRVFGPDSTQEQVFDYSLRQTVDDVLKGYNGTVLAYGQTGAGKSYTMMGPSLDGDQAGAIPRIVSRLYAELKCSENVNFEVKVSYLEVYNERVKDLLDPQSDNLPVHEDTRSSSFYVKGLTVVSAPEASVVYQTLEKGARNRAVASTNINQESSRSHSIVSLVVTQQNRTTAEHRRGQLFLVDLAGSEKVRKTGAVGQVLQEAKSINKSLSTLGMVINALTDSKSLHVPYRDSKLTRILQESLGGNSRTSLIVNCSLSSIHSSETLSTLRFGMRAKAIQNKATINAEFDPQVITPRQFTILQQYSDMLQREILRWRSGERVPPSEWAEVVPQTLTSNSNAVPVNPANAASLRRPNSACSRSTQAGTPQDSRIAFLESQVEDQIMQAKASKDQLADLFNQLQLKTAKLEEMSDAHDDAKSEVKQRDEVIGQLQIQLEQIQEQLERAHEYTEEECRNVHISTMRHNIRVLSDMRSSLLEQNSKLTRQHAMDAKKLEWRQTRILELEAQLAACEKQGDEDEEVLRKKLRTLEPKLISSPLNDPVLEPATMLV